ncbi:hypothetical protein D0T25_23780 [Duganella sp. BJB488]|nr:hypothetical protein D0T26_22770 [Duganella sp. BJB489]RFP17114.1 hypothetical protein D0T25_23780 [Duganella sp. BJB488]RFP31667.1 hypothetical protein D0T24_24935 [Duganella sp. BJB480]
MACLSILLCEFASSAMALGNAQTLRVAVGETKPPYVFSQEQRGVEVELITSLLNGAGYQPRMFYLPNKRAEMMLGIGALDAAISPRGAFLSEPYIAYQIVVHMTENAGRVPSQRVRFPMEARHDSWKAICKALRSGIIEHDRDWTEFHLRLELSKRHPSLFTLIDCYRSELQDAFELTHPTEPGTRSVPGPPLRPTHVEKKPVQFGALVAQLFCLPAADADVDTVSSNHRLARTLTRSKW